MELRFDVSAKRPEIEFALENVRVINTGSAPPYEGDYTVVPKADAPVILPTKNKLLRDDVTVTKIPYYETSNPLGDTVYIASEV